MHFTILLCLIWTTLVLGALDQCGIRSSAFSLSRHSDRIVGGKRAQRGAWPWMASILYKDIPMRFCGAAIIDRKWALTAAHCFEFDFNDTDWLVEIGKYDSNEDESYTTVRGVEKVIKHYKFDDIVGSYNDLALVKMNSSIELDLNNFTINSICIGNYDIIDHHTLDNCLAIGWGSEEKTGSSSSYLKEVKLPIVDSGICFKSHLPFKIDANTHICAGGLPHGGSGTCFGDSGSPLQCEVNGRFFLIGVTSFGRPCALPKIPDVFTKVAAFKDWILENIQRN